MLWQYLAAVRIYEQLRKSIPDGETDYPAIQHFKGNISPENLELLSRIGRVAPEDMFVPLARRTLDGNITRSELRSIWQSVRPVLGDRTARGRGVTPPRVDIHDAEQTERQCESWILTQLQSSQEFWRGELGVDRYVVVRPRKPTFDAVVIASHIDVGVRLHGIEIRANLSPNIDIKRLVKASQHCDFLWLVLAHKVSQKELDHIPTSIGILFSTVSGLELLRKSSGSQISTLDSDFCRDIIGKLLDR
jgi:hypothetical protein